MLKKAVFFCSLIILFASGALAQTPKTDDELLTETVALSKEVKEFGKVLGIEPTEALLKTSKEKPAESRTWIWIQNKGSISFETMPVLVLYFQDVKEKIPFSKIGILSGNVNIYWRSENQFSTQESAITIDFALESKWRQVEVILHEDFHKNLNLKMPWNDNETITTAVACLAALEYFQYKHDSVGVEQMNLRIASARIFSQALLAHIKNPGLVDNEAKITHDMAYYKYFDRIVALYKKSGNLKTLVEDIKKAPADSALLEKYLDELDQKYSLRNSPNPLLP